MQPQQISSSSAVSLFSFGDKRAFTPLKKLGSHVVLTLICYWSPKFLFLAPSLQDPLLKTEIATKQLETQVRNT